MQKSLLFVTTQGVTSIPPLLLNKVILAVQGLLQGAFFPVWCPSGFQSPDAPFGCGERGRCRPRGPHPLPAQGDTDPGVGVPQHPSLTPDPKGDPSPLAQDNFPSRLEDLL